MRIPMIRPRRWPSAGPRLSGDAGEAVTSLYLTYHRPLVRFAALLLPDPAAAQDVVQDSFGALRSAGPGALAADDALGYLLGLVIWRCRSARRTAVRTEHSAFASVLWTLPARQREVLALRYFAELSGIQAAAMPSLDRVRRHIAWAGLLGRAGGRGQGADEVDGAA
jgi:DNA-directed RNA polymerase specialized sigma24 family protein